MRGSFSLFYKYLIITLLLQRQEREVLYLICSVFRIPTAPGKPGKMTTVFPVLEKYWNFIIILKILEKWE